MNTLRQHLSGNFVRSFPEILYFTREIGISHLFLSHHGYAISSLPNRLSLPPTFHEHLHILVLVSDPWALRTAVLASAPGPHCAMAFDAFMMGSSLPSHLVFHPCLFMKAVLSWSPPECASHSQPSCLCLRCFSLPLSQSGSHSARPGTFFSQDLSQAS